MIEHKNKIKNNGSNHKRTIITYSPVFSYYWDGVQYTEHNNYSSGNPAFKIGDNVELMINPDDPKEFYAPDDSTPKTFSIISLLQLAGLC